MENEIWKDVVGFEGWLQVSDLGNVRRKTKYSYKLLKPRMIDDQLCIRVKKHGKVTQRIVGYLVADAFLDNYPSNVGITHKDGDKRNNNINNLEIGNPNLYVSNKGGKGGRRRSKYNEYEEKGDIVFVRLGRCSEIMLCDADDWERLKDIYWFTNQGYVMGQVKRKYILFHRQVKQCPKGYVIDHINRNPLDNRKVNLRVVTQSVNMMNMTINRNNKVGHTGITPCKYGYIVNITAKKKRIYLGTYKTLEEAIKTRKEAEEKYHKSVIEKETLF